MPELAAAVNSERALRWTFYSQSAAVVSSFAVDCYCELAFHDPDCTLANCSCQSVCVGKGQEDETIKGKQLVCEFI